MVLYKNGAPLWSSQTHGRSTGNLVMQGDGNLKLYSPGGTPVWHTYTFGQPGAALAVQNDGNLVLYRNGNAIWNTGTYGN